MRAPSAEIASARAAASASQNAALYRGTAYAVRDDRLSTNKYEAIFLCDVFIFF
jgi:hypothetical protein